MSNSTRVINIQAQSFGKYMQDIWFVAFILLFVQNETSISLPILWIGLQLIVAIVSLFIFSKIGPNNVVPFIVPSVVMLFLFVFETPFWLFAIALGISIWRIQARFNTLQHEQTSESSFTLLLQIIFIVVFLFGGEEDRFLLCTLFIIGIALFFGIRFFSVSMRKDKHNYLTKVKTLSVYFVSIFTVGGLSFSVYFIAPLIHKVLGFLFEAVLSVVIIPFIPIMEKIEEFFNGLETSKEVGISRQSGGLPKRFQGKSSSEELTSNFHFEWLLLGLLIIVLLLFLLYLLKKKPEKLEVELNNLEYENEQMGDEKEKQKTPFNYLYKTETSFLREKYVQFELEAQRFNLIRSKDETVREWFKRMDWNVDAVFFQIYEELRYGGQSISSDKAELFLKNLEEIKTNYFLKNDV